MSVCLSLSRSLCVCVSLFIFPSDTFSLLLSRCLYLFIFPSAILYLPLSLYLSLSFSLSLSHVITPPLSVSVLLSRKTKTHPDRLIQTSKNLPPILCFFFSLPFHILALYLDLAIGYLGVTWFLAFTTLLCQARLSQKLVVRSMYVYFEKIETTNRLGPPVTTSVLNPIG